MTSTTDRSSRSPSTSALTRCTLILGVVGLAALLGWTAASRLTWLGNALVDTLASFTFPFREAVAAMAPGRLG